MTSGIIFTNYKFHRPIVPSVGTSRESCRQEIKSCRILGRMLISFGWISLQKMIRRFFWGAASGFFQWGWWRQTVVWSIGRLLIQRRQRGNQPSQSCVETIVFLSLLRDYAQLHRTVVFLHGSTEKSQKHGTCTITWGYAKKIPALFGGNGPNFRSNWEPTGFSAHSLIGWKKSFCLEIPPPL